MSMLSCVAKHFLYVNKTDEVFKLRYSPLFLDESIRLCDGKLCSSSVQCIKKAAAVKVKK